MFHERKLELIGFTVRVCGYQPQGVPESGTPPPPENQFHLNSRLHGVAKLAPFSLGKIFPSIIGGLYKALDVNKLTSILGVVTQVNVPGEIFESGSDARLWRH